MPCTGPRHRRRSGACTVGGGASSPGSGTVHVSVARSPDELGPALEEAFALHARRWEGRPDGSGFASTTGRRFHRATLARLAAIDVARIVTLRVAGRAVAFHYYFALEGCMYVHRLAFDPDRGTVLARAREHARRDRGRRRRRSPEGRVPRRRRALQGRAGGSLRAALRRRRRDVECSRASLCRGAHERHPSPAAPQALLEGCAGCTSTASHPCAAWRVARSDPPCAYSSQAAQGSSAPTSSTRCSTAAPKSRWPTTSTAARSRGSARPCCAAHSSTSRTCATSPRCDRRSPPPGPRSSSTWPRRSTSASRWPIRPSTPRSTWPGPCRCWRPRARSVPAGW